CHDNRVYVGTGSMFNRINEATGFTVTQLRAQLIQFIDSFHIVQNSIFDGRQETGPEAII
ncbi:MAG: hypothetical protein WBP26_04760, partial [Candidatus Saccharimonadales bacterium]